MRRDRYNEESLSSQSKNSPKCPNNLGAHKNPSYPLTFRSFAHNHSSDTFKTPQHLELLA